ncbi:MAG TPA: hypothetical protein VET48_02185, partial [Steroidobacteraceae bacterium]|nr:hypothetical protein [Steroidobacteraceae bacterium]
LHRTVFKTDEPEQLCLQSLFCFREHVAISRSGIARANKCIGARGHSRRGCAPLRDHRVRLKLSPDTSVADASHWLLLGTARSSQSLGRLVAAEHFTDPDALRAWLKRQSIGENCLLSGGQTLREEQLAAIAGNREFTSRFDYRHARSYYDSQSGAAVGEFLRSDYGIGTQLLHINADPDERFSVMWVEKC